MGDEMPPPTDTQRAEWTHTANLHLEEFWRLMDMDDNLKTFEGHKKRKLETAAIPASSSTSCAGSTTQTYSRRT